MAFVRLNYLQARRTKLARAATTRVRRSEDSFFINLALLFVATREALLLIANRQNVFVVRRGVRRIEKRESQKAE